MRLGGWKKGKNNDNCNDIDNNNDDDKNVGNGYDDDDDGDDDDDDDTWIKVLRSNYAKMLLPLLDKSSNIYITVYVHIMVEFHLKCCHFPSHFLASQEVVFC